MTLSDRDRKLLTFIVPIVVLVAYWFLLLSPKREEASKVTEQVVAAEQARDQAVAQADQQAAAKDSFERDYTEIVRLGKAVPPTVDMASLLVQLDHAAKGTNIDFNKISAGERVSATGDNGQQGAAPAEGSQPASAAGEAKQSAENAKDQAEGQAQESDAASNNAGQAAGGTTAVAPPAGLDVVPLQLSFTGSFFDLADFMHRLKRYVSVRGENVAVRGRLMRIESLKLTPLAGTQLTAEMTASVYLSPKTEGTTAGATPQGPAPAESTPASGEAQPPAPTTSGMTR
jgi:Tfp pilus assembly protein PilO